MAAPTDHYGSVIWKDTPWALFRLNDTGSTAVEVVRSFNASIVGGVTKSVAGLIPTGSDKCMTFNGSTGYVDGTSHTWTPIDGDNTCSVECWFKTSSTGQQQLFDGGTEGVFDQAFTIGLTQTNGIGSSPPTNTPGIYVSFWACDFYMPGLNLGDGNVHYLVVTRSGTTLNVFIDLAQPSGYIWNGTSWSSSSQPVTLPSTPATADAQFTIGTAGQAIWSTGSAFFNGSVDDFAVYDQALSLSQVTTHYRAAFARMRGIPPRNIAPHVAANR